MKTSYLMQYKEHDFFANVVMLYIWKQYTHEGRIITLKKPIYQECLY